MPLYLLNGAFAEGSIALAGWEAASSGAGAAFTGLLGPLRELTAAMWAADAAEMVGEAPFWLIAAAIGAVIAVVAALALAVRKYWGPISAFLGGVGQGIAEAFGPAADGLRDLFGWIGPVAKALGTLLEPIRSTVAQLDGFRDAGRNFGRTLGDAILSALGPIGLVIKGLQQIHDLLPHGASAPVVAGGAHAAQIHAGVAAGGRPGQAAPPGRGPANVHVHVAPSPTTITVHAAPGQDPHHVGQAVHQALDQRDRAAAARARSAYADGGREP